MTLSGQCMHSEFPLGALLPLRRWANAGKFAIFALLSQKLDLSCPMLLADFPQMNFTQMQDQLRDKLLRRIDRGTLSVTLLARQTELATSHLSNFLHGRGRLSDEAMDCILSAQDLTAEDLLPSRNVSAENQVDGEFMAIPVVSHHVAMFEPIIRPSVWQDKLQISARLLNSMRLGTTSARTKWQRFIAVRVPAMDSAPMEPVILPGALALLDRHYTSLKEYEGNRPTLYAVRAGARLALRYVDFQNDRLVLRPRNLAFRVQLLETAPGESPNDLMVGRVALVTNEM